MNEEKEFQEAEKVRLLYVAVTRAAYWLVVCGRAPERPKEKDANDQNAQTAPPKPQAPKTFWQRVVDTPEVKTCKELEEGVKAGNPDLAAALESLRTGQCLTHVGAQGQSNGIAPEEVSPETQELKLKELARERAEIKSYAITPSKLDHDSRSVTPRIKKLGDEGTAALQTGSGDAAQASPVTAEGPCGADWGTIVHRVMELAVRENRYDSDALKRFACQAVEETLPSLLSKGQRQELLGNQPMDMKQAKAYISEKATGAVSFLAKEDSPLRKEMEGAVCYPELPFVLRVEENSGDLYRHLSAHISDVNARNKPMDVQGIIDLAIRRADGSWVIVDYKTDKLCSGESADQLKARLSRKYTPQILTYAKVLELSGLGSVTHVYLCSVPLGGELIPLTL